jgi:hypothetical protein
LLCPMQLEDLAKVGERHPYQRGVVLEQRQLSVLFFLRCRKTNAPCSVLLLPLRLPPLCEPPELIFLAASSPCSSHDATVEYLPLLFSCLKTLAFETCLVLTCFFCRASYLFCSPPSSSAAAL